MDVYVVHVNFRGTSQPIGVYADINQAREEADAHAVTCFGSVDITQTTSTVEGVEMRVHFKDGNPIGSHAIYRFTLDEEVKISDMPEDEFKPRRGMTFDDV